MCGVGSVGRVGFGVPKTLPFAGRGEHCLSNEGPDVPLWYLWYLWTVEAAAYPFKGSFLHHGHGHVPYTGDPMLLTDITATHSHKLDILNRHVSKAALDLLQ